VPEGTAVDRGSNKKQKTEGERVEVARRPRWHHPGLTTTQYEERNL